MKIAIVGSRDFTDYEFMFEKCQDFIECIIRPDEIISGGQRGADTLSEHIAAHYNIPHRHIHADWSLGLRAGPMRNREIAEVVDVVLAFPLSNSKGTYDMITQSRRLRKNVHVYMK